jgi:hypothetical protein
MWLKCLQISALHINLNLFLQQIVSDTNFTWKTYILQDSFIVNSVHDACM